MRGTEHSTDGFRRASRRQPPAKVRVFGFVVVVTLGALLIAWINRSIWRQVGELQTEFAAIKSESFYLATHLSGTIRTLNDTLLWFTRTRDPATRTQFLKDAGALREWLRENRAHLADLETLRLFKEEELLEQLAAFQTAEMAFNRYLLDADRLLAPGQPPVEDRGFAGVYEQVQAAAREALAASDALAVAQDRAFDLFLDQTQQTLATHQQLLKLSLALILLLALALAALVYRGMIAPLRVRLTESQAIIERQEKLASLGVLAAGVAHEIRNPLTAIKFRLFSLKKFLPPDFAHHEDADVISTEINRLEHIVRDFLQFARPVEPELARLSVGSLLDEVSALLKEPLEKAAIELRLDAPVPLWVHADSRQIKQVLINLVQNAADSIGRNGTITLRARPDAALLTGRHRPAAVLAVLDTGQGMTPEIERRLFDPFFSTKEGGTGLGLAIAARIVEKHGGLLRHQTQLNRGTTFEIVLPRIEDDATETPHH
jgi:signal transduction histidine kinase